MKNSLRGLAAISIVAAALGAQANLITDGGFEIPVAAPSTFIQANGGSSVGAWSVVGNDVLVINNAYNEAPPIVFTALEGVQALDLTGAGNTGLTNGVFQNIATVAGQQYDITFSVGRAQGQAGDDRYQTAAVARLLVDGSTALIATNNDTVAAGTIGWRQFSYSFIATGSTTRIEFLNGVPTQGNPGWNNYVGLDDVQVVPEPMTMTALGLGLAALARRRARKA